MEQFKQILRQAIRDKASEVVLVAGHKAVIHSKTGVAEHAGAGVLESAWLTGVVNQLFGAGTAATESLAEPSKGELNVSGLGRVILILTMAPQQALRLYLPPDGEAAAKAYWEELKKPKAPEPPPAPEFIPPPPPQIITAQPVPSSIFSPGDTIADQDMGGISDNSSPFSEAQETPSSIDNWVPPVPLPTVPIAPVDEGFSLHGVLGVDVAEAAPEKLDPPVFDAELPKFALDAAEYSQVSTKEPTLGSQDQAPINQMPVGSSVADMFSSSSLPIPPVPTEPPAFAKPKTTVDMPDPFSKDLFGLAQAASSPALKEPNAAPPPPMPEISIAAFEPAPIQPAPFEPAPVIPVAMPPPFLGKGGLGLVATHDPNLRAGVEAFLKEHGAHVEHVASAELLAGFLARESPDFIFFDDGDPDFSRMFKLLYDIDMKKRETTFTALVSHKMPTGNSKAAFGFSVDLVVNHADIARLRDLCTEGLAEKSRVADVWKSVN